MAVNAAPITVYVQKDDAPFDIKKIYAFSGGPSLPTSEGTVGYWPGVDLTNTTTINGVNYYYYSFDEAITKVSVIFSDGTNNNQTKDIKDIQHISFSEKDVVRHHLVQDIIKAYAKTEERRKNDRK